MTRYSAGVVGCGGIGRVHAKTYQSIDSVEVIACSDINPKSLNSFSEDYQIPKKYTDYREMLNDVDLDFVSVCTWPRAHCEITLEAVRNGAKGIMCEKPLAVNLEEADKMIETCHSNKVVLAVGHEHRFDSQSVKARGIIESGHIGKLNLIWGHCGLDLMNNGTHVIDLVNYLNMDFDAVWVIGQIDRRKKRLGAANHPDMYVEDMAVGYIKYRNNTKAVIELGEFAPQNYIFHVYGAKGQIEVNSPEASLKVMTPQGIEFPNVGKTNSFRAEIVELIRAVEEDREHLSSGLRGRATLEIIMAIFESARTRTLIELPLDVKENPLEQMIRENVI
jgi:predicted dehydrogenase